MTLRLLYRLVLLACPSDYRRTHAAEMEALFVECVGRERARRPSLWPFALLRGLLDTLAFSLALRRDRFAGHAIVPYSPQTRRKAPMKLQDLRLALRQLRRRPMFATGIVGMLGLGIGATTAIFSVVNGVLLKPLPFPNPDQIVQVWGAFPSRNINRVAWSEANVWDVHDLNRSFSAFGSWHSDSFTLTGTGVPERVAGARVSVGFFQALAPRPILGRVFETGEDAVGAPGDRVILSHRFWTRRFAADPAIVGKTLTLNGRAYTVVGVLPTGMVSLASADAFVPQVRRADANRGSWEYSAIGRLRDGVTMDAALADVQRVARELEARHPDANKGMTAVIGSSRAWVANDTLTRTLWVLLGATALLLLIACVNVANLLLVHASSRVREAAVRAALGARRIDLVRERLTESAVFSMGGAVVGWFVAWGTVNVFKTLNPGGIPRLADVELDAAALAFTVAIAAVVALVTGIVPALRAPVTNVVTAIRQSQRGSVGSRHDERLRAVLVAAEVALSVTMLVGAGLLVRSLVQVMSTDRGFQTEERLLANVSIPASYPEARREEIVESILARVQALPQVISVAGVSARPIAGGSTGMNIGNADAPAATAPAPWASWRIVSKDYFKTMGLPLIGGRDFNEHDIIEKPWRAIISKRVADELWPGVNPVGKTALLWKGQGNIAAEVIGVVGNMRERGLEQNPTLAVYLPAYGTMGGATSLELVMHTRGAPEATIPQLQSLVRDVDPNLPVSEARSFEDVVTRSVATRRFTMLLLVVFAGLALVLSAAGVYGVLAYTVARRTAEFGVRLALGASPGRVLARVFSAGMYPVATGLAIGAGASYWISQVMSSLLFEIQPNDPMTYATMIAAVSAVAALACYIPARRVLKVDPVVALRAE
jgi:putative ABC transport system permease protein